MRFTRTDEHEEMARSLRDLLAAASTTEMAREWPTEGGHWRATWNEIAEIGVLGVTAPESVGGLALEPAAMVAVLEEIGYSGLPGPVIESIAVLPVLLQDHEHLAHVVSGRSVATAAFTERTGSALDADRADAIFVCTGDRVGLLESVTIEPATSIDPTRRLFDVTAEKSTAVLHGASERVDEAFDRGCLGAAALCLGTARRLLDLSTAHVRQRHQFGRPIGEFQAVKHHLANALLELEFARPLVHGACVSTAAGAACAGRDISAANVTASEAVHRAARTALQVHGAIGYTAEHDLHLWITRAEAMRSSWGTRGWHRQRVATALRSDGDTPIGAS